jgi:hypothetical protein
MSVLQFLSDHVVAGLWFVFFACTATHLEAITLGNKLTKNTMTIKMFENRKMQHIFINTQVPNPKYQHTPSEEK